MDAGGDGVDELVRRLEVLGVVFGRAAEADEGFVGLGVEVDYGKVVD